MPTNPGNSGAAQDPSLVNPGPQPIFAPYTGPVNNNPYMTPAMRGFAQGYYTGGPGGGLQGVGQMPGWAGYLQWLQGLQQPQMQFAQPFMGPRFAPRAPMPSFPSNIPQGGQTLLNPGPPPIFPPGNNVLPPTRPFPFQGGLGGWMPPPPLQPL